MLPPRGVGWPSGIGWGDSSVFRRFESRIPNREGCLAAVMLWGVCDRVVRSMQPRAASCCTVHVDTRAKPYLVPNGTENPSWPQRQAEEKG